MECFQKGPKATVGRVQCLEAPPEGSRQPGYPGARGLQVRWLWETPGPQGCGAPPCSVAPQGTCLEVWEAG